MELTQETRVVYAANCSTTVENRRISAHLNSRKNCGSDVSPFWMTRECVWSESGWTCEITENPEYEEICTGGFGYNPEAALEGVLDYYDTVYTSDGPTLIDESKEYSEPVDGESTSDLISRVTGLLPSEPNGSACSAFRNLSEDESSFSIRKFKWKLKHAPTGTCYLKVWLRQRFEPEGGGSPVDEEVTYEWTGSGNPCLADDTKAPGDEANEIEGAENSVDVPAADGTTTIEVVKYSCVPGYTPDPDNGKPSGFPDPENP